MERDSMVFYRSFYDAINSLQEEEQLPLYKAIFELSLNGEDVDLQGIQKVIFTLIKPQLSANIKRYENGKQGGRKPKDNQTETKTEPKRNQNKSKTKANNNVNDNVNVNVNDKEAQKSIDLRAAEFALLVKLTVKEKRSKYLFYDAEVEKFIRYWTEHGEKDRKMRYEKQDSFSVERRLDTWFENSKQFKQSPQQLTTCR